MWRVRETWETIVDKRKFIISAILTEKIQHIGITQEWQEWTLLHGIYMQSTQRMQYRPKELIN